MNYFKNRNYKKRKDIKHRKHGGNNGSCEVCYWNKFYSSRRRLTSSKQAINEYLSAA